MSWRRIELNSASMPASSRITSAAVAQSRRAKASSVRRSIEIASSAACPSSTGGGCTAPRSCMLFAMRAIFCASSPICSTRERIESRSRSYCLEACSLMPMGLSKPSGDVVLRLLLLRLDEQLVGHAVLDQLAEVHVGGEVRDARRLLHVVRHDQDGDALLEIVDQLLDQGGGDRVERRGRLVEQQQFR